MCLCVERGLCTLSVVCQLDLCVDVLWQLYGFFLFVFDLCAGCERRICGRCAVYLGVYCVCVHCVLCVASAVCLYCMYCV